MKRRGKTLSCTVTRDGVLRIEIGMDTLACAALGSEYVERLCRDQANAHYVVHNRGFAVDVMRELRDEAEDGSTILTRALDQAIECAIENGTEFFVPKGEV